MARILGKFVKQPVDVLDYDVDYSDWMSGRTDTVASYEAEADAGIDLITSTRSGNVVKILLGGGFHGERYKITTRITTAAGLVKEAEFIVAVKEV